MIGGGARKPRCVAPEIRTDHQSEGKKAQARGEASGAGIGLSVASVISRLTFPFRAARFPSKPACMRSSCRFRFIYLFIFAWYASVFILRGFFADFVDDPVIYLGYLHRAPDERAVGRNARLSLQQITE